MTWDDLLNMMNNMREAKHTCLDKKVQCIVDGVLYDLDLFESITTGNVILIPEVVDSEEEAHD